MALRREKARRIIPRPQNTVAGSRMKRFKVKRLKDGRAMLNLACGGHMHPEWNNLDFSLLVRLARHPHAARIFHKLHILSNKRYQRLLQTDPDIICWDLRKGVPFDSDVFDVVYHSHFMEHLDRRVVPGFLRECRRVLKPAGILRVVVPDLQVFCRNYLDSYESLVRQSPLSEASVARHHEAISTLIGQMVVADPYGTTEQPYFVRVCEQFVRGNNIESGEAHRWMYDGFTLKQLLGDMGFTDVQLRTFSEGAIESWRLFGLDDDGNGSPYKSMSLYVEARK
jgi:SAM-dependent methyltransferase